MDKSEEKKQLEYQHILEQLLKLPENKYCADCGSAAPRWASATLGIFVCMKCSGIHRSLSTDISFVRSVTLDKWTAEQVENMRNMGNGRAKTIWEAKVPKNHPRPGVGDGLALERWIRDKYEMRRFYKAPEAANTTKSNDSSNVRQTPTLHSPQQPRLQQQPVSLFAAPTQPATLLHQHTPAPTQPPTLLHIPSPTIPNRAPAPQQIYTPAQPVVKQVAPQHDPDFGEYTSGASSNQNGQVMMQSPPPTADNKKSNILSLFDVQHQPVYHHPAPYAHPHSQNQIPHQNRVPQNVPPHTQYHPHYPTGVPNTHQQQNGYGNPYAHPQVQNHAQPHIQNHIQPHNQPAQYHPQMQHNNYAYNTAIPTNGNGTSHNTYGAQYRNPHVQHDDLLHKINTMGQEKRRQEFSIFDV